VRTRLYVAGVLAGVAAVLVLAFVVLQFGISNPSPPSLGSNPHDEIPGSILYFDNSGCVVDALASGRSASRVYCPLAGAGYSDTVTWVDEKTFAYVVTAPLMKQPGWQWVKVDLATKRETTVTAAASPPAAPGDLQMGALTSVRGEQISFDPDGYLYRVSGGDRVRIYKLPGGNGSGAAFATWSPDGEWFVLRYYPKNELWIIRRDGLAAGTLASNVRGGASWIIPGTGIWPPVDAALQ